MTTVKKRAGFGKFVSQNMMLCILLVMVVVLAIFADGFLTLSNLLGILRSVAITGVIAFGMTMRKNSARDAVRKKEGGLRGMLSDRECRRASWG